MVELNPLGSLANQTSAIQTLNENFDKIEAGFEDVVTLTEGGAMLSPLDMNGQRLLNLPSPRSANEPARWQDVTDSLTIEGVVVPSLDGNSGKFLQVDSGEEAVIWTDVTGNYVLQSNNGSDFDDVEAVRDNLGLGTMATANIDDYGSLSANVTRTGRTTLLNSITLAGTVDHRLTGTFDSLSAESVGFRGVPTDSQDSDYTFVLNDSGKCKYHTSGVPHTFSIPVDSSVAYPTGTIIIVDNVGSGTVTLNRQSGVALRREGSATDTNFSLAQWGVAVLRKRAANSWVVSGSNLS
jgi:hypothetical protein